MKLKNLIKKYFLLDFSKDELQSIRDDIHEENRNSLIVYSAIIAGGMFILLFLSMFVNVLVSSRKSYIYAIAASLFIFILSVGPAKKSRTLIVICQYLLMLSLFAFGILLGTVVEPNQASMSFAVLLFAVPLLFTDLPYRINLATVIAITIYVALAKITQSAAMFGFNLSVIMPYGLANLIITYFISKQKIERHIYAQRNQRLSEIDQLTGLKNRRSFEGDVAQILNEKNCHICIGSFDVNGLKLVNDNIGHKAGDELLIAASKVLEKAIMEYGTCYRVGGDEYMAIIKNKEIDCQKIIEQIDKNCRNYKSIYDFSLSISSGFSNGNSNDIDLLISEADKQMYLSKNDYYINTGIDRRTH